MDVKMFTITEALQTMKQQAAKGWLDAHVFGEFERLVRTGAAVSLSRSRAARLGVSPDATCISGSVPNSGAGSRIVKRHGNQRLAHSSAAVLPHRVFLQLAAVFVVTLGLLGLSGCA